MLQRVPRSGILVGKFLEPQTIRGNRPSRFRAHRMPFPASARHANGRNWPHGRDHQHRIVHRHLDGVRDRRVG